MFQHNWMTSTKVNILLVQVVTIDCFGSGEKVGGQVQVSHVTAVGTFSENCSVNVTVGGRYSNCCAMNFRYWIWLIYIACSTFTDQ
jgi:hypothetical protein